MDKVIFVGFDTEKQAYDADRALHEMHRDGTITLYDDAVVVKSVDGTVTVRQGPDVQGAGTLSGMITGSLIGLLGGPVGAVVGLSTGTLVGAAFDVAAQGLTKDFVEDAGAHLAPGRAAVIAEVDEEWQVPLETRMEALGGIVLRRTPAQIGDALIVEQLETAQKDLANLENEKLAAVKSKAADKSAQTAAKLDAKIAEARATLQEKENELTAKLQTVREDGREKIATLEAQKTMARVESRAQLEHRLNDVRSRYEARIEKLHGFIERRKGAHKVG